MSKGHHFLLLHITADDADEIKCSMDPTQGSLTTIDESGVILLQMKDNKSQNVKIIATNATGTTEKILSIEDMTFAPQGE